MIIPRRLLSVLAIAATCQAQLSGLDLSMQCQAAAVSLLQTPLATCANILGLAGVLSSSGSVITPLENWLTGACSQTCSPATLTNVSGIIASGCATDLQSGNTIAEGLQAIITNYTDVKQLLCLQATSNSTFCLANLLTGIQNSTGQTETTTGLTSLLTGGVNGIASIAQGLTADTLCTDCNKGLVTDLFKLFGTSPSSGTTGSTLSSKCGAAFVDGTVPSTVSDPASSGPSGSTSSGASTSTSSSQSQTASGSVTSATSAPANPAERVRISSALIMNTLFGGILAFVV